MSRRDSNRICYFIKRGRLCPSIPSAERTYVLGQFIYPRVATATSHSIRTSRANPDVRLFYVKSGFCYNTIFITKKLRVATTISFIGNWVSWQIVFCYNRQGINTGIEYNWELIGTEGSLWVGAKIKVRKQRKTEHENGIPSFMINFGFQEDKKSRTNLVLFD